jgi:hypothetical protein
MEANGDLILLSPEGGRLGPSDFFILLFFTEVNFYPKLLRDTGSSS